MEHTNRLFVIEDDPCMSEMLAAILAECGIVECFATAEACLQRLPEQMPDIFIVDVGLPGMDGYQLSRELKADSTTAAPPILFISSNDTIEARLRGYEAGGKDFIVKPFDAATLVEKVRLAQHVVVQHKQLHARAADAEHTAFSAICTLGSLGAVIEFLRKSYACSNSIELGQELLAAISQYGLQGAVRIRIDEEAHCVSPQGTEVPLEASVLEYVSTLGRIFQFQKRAVFNYGGITLLISNMPIEDAERCGSLRDNLAILAEGADERRRILEIEGQKQQTRHGLLAAIETLQGTLDGIHQERRREQFSATHLVINVQEELVSSFVKLGLSENQENMIIEQVKRHIGKILDQIRQGDQVINQLEQLSKTLRSLAA